MKLEKLSGGILVLTFLFIGACGGNSGTNEKEAVEALTPEQETELADSIAGAYDSIQSEVKTMTKETLEEVDSLLNSID